MPTWDDILRTSAILLHELITKGPVVWGYYTKKLLTHPQKIIHLKYTSGLWCKQMAKLSLLS